MFCPKVVEEPWEELHGFRVLPSFALADGLSCLFVSKPESKGYEINITNIISSVCVSLTMSTIQFGSKFFFSKILLKPIPLFDPHDDYDEIYKLNEQESCLRP